MIKIILALIVSTNLIAMPAMKVSSMVNNNYLQKYEDDFEKKAKDILETTEAAMKAIPETNNIELDFLNELIGLHSEEIRLSLNIQEFTNNPQVIQYANRLLAAENGELREMRIYRKDISAKGANTSENSKEYLSEYNKIINARFETLKGYKHSKDPEVDYLNIIKINNENSIQLAKNVIKYTKDDITKKIAENIINIKTTQIKDANKILEALNK